ncbi:MAG: hypothetical protein CL489_10445 [Acidobacteria bacterium]|nr:hypothetical protein [Acidobacteriota bacterium]|tara:strand:+ start:733 stop:1122 length:390 start_codon:yes stop_codon:yes gene_type:complete
MKLEIEMRNREWLIDNAKAIRKQMHKYASCYKEDDPRVTLDLVLREALELGLAQMDYEIMIHDKMTEGNFARLLKRGDHIIKNDGKIYEVKGIFSIPTQWHGKPGKSMETTTRGYRLELKHVDCEVLNE